MDAPPPPPGSTQNVPDHRDRFVVLGLESTCDETAAAVVAFDGGKTAGARPQILGECIASQIALHAPFRGVAPEAAARAHTEVFSRVVAAALDQAGVRFADLRGIAVSRSPGLVGCLLTGLTVAKTLSWRLQIPWVGVDHIQAHIHAAYLAAPTGAPGSSGSTGSSGDSGRPADADALGDALGDAPHVALVVSGGHTALYRVADRATAPDLIGCTRDDAAGEAFDKVAALLGLPYPGGPAIEAAAREGNPRAFDFPRSKLHDADDDFSFSGLKTAVLYGLRGSQGKPGPAATVGIGRVLSAREIADCAASFQAAACEVLVGKTLRAARRLGLQHVSVGGGVACNGRLRELFAAAAAKEGITVVFPPKRYCTDNAVMVALLGAPRLLRGERDPFATDVDPTPVRRRVTRAPAMAEPSKSGQEDG
ncbi:MAG: tRNA (adenosine(37)-N6)-threonylcarbamoyltransferase complex transferase subunit TsaD [Planctomycetota bacterium]